MSIYLADNFIRPGFDMILEQLWHRTIHMHLGLFQQVRSEARITLMSKHLVGYNTRTYVINTNLPFCSKPNMFESHNSMIVFAIIWRPSYSNVLETMRYMVINNNQAMNQTTPAKPKGALYELLW